MKMFICALALMGSTSAFAGTAACNKLASNTALQKVSAKVADDCFVKFVQPGKADANVINVGIACDHTGSYLYTITTKPEGALCYVAKIKSRVLGE